jgi:hypothetical protein
MAGKAEEERCTVTASTMFEVVLDCMIYLQAVVNEMGPAAKEAQRWQEEVEGCGSWRTTIWGKTTGTIVSLSRQRSSIQDDV